MTKQASGTEDQPDPADIVRLAKKIVPFRQSLSQESDRGCALLAASFLDQELKSLLKVSFVQDTSSEERLFGAQGIFGTFSSKIEAAYYLGKLSESMRKDLHQIRKIRNEFGHDPNPISFSDQKILARCTNFSWSWRDDNGTGRQHFTAAVCAALAHIHVATLETITPKALDYPPTSMERVKKAMNSSPDIQAALEALLRSSRSSASETPHPPESAPAPPAE